MMPKTEKELDLIFELFELFELKKLADRPYTYYGSPSQQESCQKYFKERKQEFLNKANEN